MPIAHADVRVRRADAACRPLAEEIGSLSDETGEFVARLDAPTQESHRGCAVVDARSGGAFGIASVPVDFAVASPRARVDVRLVDKQPLTRSEAQRLVELLAAAINEPAAAVPDLNLYNLHGPEALRVALEQYRKVLGRVSSMRPAESLIPNASTFTFEMTGSSGRSSRVDVLQQELTRLHSPLLDYAFRAERFISAYLRAISSGDAERLSRVLNPDDVDFPIKRAREIIVDYRRRYADTSAIRAEFVSVDERRHTMTYRLHGAGPGGAEVTETIELGFGDGLIGVRWPE